MKIQTILACMVLSAFLLPHANGDDEGATITGKIFLPTDSPVKIESKKLAINIEEQVEYDDPPLPDNFKEMTDEEREAWYLEFEKSEAGKKYEKTQREKFENRRKYKIELDDDGKFEVKEVVPGKYMINGYTEEKIGGKTFQFVVNGELTVGEAKRIELEPLPIDVVRVLARGDAAPAFKIDDLNEGEINLSDFKGKYVFIDFWATWCGPCKQSTPKVKELFEAYADGKELILVGISVDDPPAKEEAQKYTNENGLNWKQGFTGGFDHQITTDYGINGIPSFWLIDPDGKILLTDQEFFASFNESMDIKGVVQKTIKEHKEKKN